MEILLSKYNDNEAILDIVQNSFEPGKSKYHIKWTFDFNGNEQFFEYELTPSTGSNNIPAVRLGYALNLDTPTVILYHAIFSAPTCQTRMQINLGASGGTDIGVMSAELVDSDGDIGVTMSDWARPDPHIFIGTVAECNLRITIDADFPIFLGELALYEQFMVGKVGDAYYNTEITQDNANIVNCVSGDMSAITEARNYANSEYTIPRDRTFFIRNQLKKNGALVETKDLKFQIPEGAKIWLVASEHEPTGQTYNMNLHMSGLGLPPTFKWKTVGGAWNVAHILTNALRLFYYGTWTDYGNGDLYKVVGRSKGGTTNIPIFADEETGDRYGDGLIGENVALNSGDLGYDDNISTGDSLESSDIPNPVIAGSGAGVNVWLLDKGNLNAIFADLYSDTQSIIDDIKKGTWQWGNNPIDFIVSIYYVPFNVSNFYDTTTERVWLGQYDTGHDYTQAKETKSSGQRIVLVNTTIDNVYGDFRDIDFFKYDLFLPYVGFVPLDPNVYVGHSLKVEMAFDVMTHNIRYYLFCDGIVTDRVDGSVGYNIPITGTDMVNKARSNLSGLKNMIEGSAEALGGAWKSATDVTAMVTNMGIGGLGKVAAGALEMAQYPKQLIRGDISSSMNIYDINYVYLKITERQSIYPPEIRQIYNNPCYVVGPISNLHGYCEIENIQLKSNCTESEYNEIINLLKGGVII